VGTVTTHLDQTGPLAGPGTTACPPEADLVGYLLGRLPAADLDRVATHIDHCPRCENRADALELRAADSLVAGLRGVARPPADVVDTMPAAAESGGSRPPLAGPPLAGGPLVGPYRLGRLLGRGGMGTVYRATDTALGRAVALKVLPAGRAGDGDALARFRREVKAIGRLTGPHIVQALAAGEADGVPYLAMELVEGIDLARVVRRLGPLSTADACELARQAALGLREAHAQGLVHRDVKPSNLILGRGPADPPAGPPLVKLLDLGLALCAGGCSGDGDPDTPTADNALLGTRDYMSPEQWDDTHAVDARSDLYSLGCTLYHLVAGRPPFHGPGFESLPRKMTAHQSATPEPPSRHRPGAPADLDSVILRMLAKSPAGRYPDATTTAAVLEPFAAGADLRALLDAAAARPEASDQPDGTLDEDSPTEPAVGPHRRKVPRRRRAALAGMAAAVIAAAIAVPWMIEQRPVAHLIARLGGHGGSSVQVVQFGPNGLAVSGGRDLTLKLWDTNSGRAVHELRLPGTPGGGGVRATAVSPDGRSLVALSGKHLSVFNTDTGGERWVVDHVTTTAEPGGLAVSPDNKRVYAVADRRVRCWDLETGHEAPSLTGAESALNELALAPGGHVVAAGGNSSAVWLWHTDRPEAPTRLPGGEGDPDAVHGLHFRPDGRQLIGTGERSVYVWDVTSGRLERSFGLFDPGSRDSALSPDGSQLVVAGNHGVRSYAVNSGAAGAASPAFAQGPGVRSVCVSPDGKSVLVAQADGVSHWKMPRHPARDAK
jgi:serine/threonine protein kinase/WD40 repeat protein